MVVLQEDILKTLVDQLKLDNQDLKNKIVDLLKENYVLRQELNYHKTKVI